MADDLQIPAGPGIPTGLVIAGAELTERFSRSSGPGGQSVNTADSRVELEFDVARSAALTDAQRRRVLRRLDSRLHSDGRLSVVAAEHRSQYRNRQAARQRLAELLRAALAPPPPPRRPTRPSRASVRRRLEGKRHRAQLKAMRRRPD